MPRHLNPFDLPLLAAVFLLAAPLAQATPTTPTSDFTDNQDGTVTHKTTGLSWMRCVIGQTWDGSTCSGATSYQTFDQAKALTSSFAGHNDWRLPTPWELASIVDYGIAYPGPAINATIFPNATASQWYSSFWTASPLAGSSNYAWNAVFADGAVRNDVTTSYYSGKAMVVNQYAVRLVRGTPSSGTLTTPSSDFSDNGDGTVTHKKTSLTWMRCAMGQIWSNNSCTGTTNTYTFDQATTLTNAFAGKTDWRTPSIQELLSIVEYGAKVPAINTTVFPGTPGSYFWSATPAADSSSGAWNVNFDYGGGNTYGATSSGNGNRSDGYSVRLVRGTQSPGATSSTGGADCLFNWAEQTYPELFAPSGAVSNTSGDYYYRYYTATKAYLATKSSDSHVYYLGTLSGNSVMDVGALSPWLATAGCQ